MPIRKSDQEIFLADEVRRAIKRRKKELGITTNELSKLSTVPKSTLDCYFSGDADMSTGKTMIVLKALNVKIRLVRSDKT